MGYVRRQREMVWEIEETQLDTEVEKDRIQIYAKGGIRHWLGARAYPSGFGLSSIHHRERGNFYFRTYDVGSNVSDAPC